MSRPGLLDAMVIGAQKAGSTSLQAGLAEHSGVFMTEGEDPVFERRDLDDQAMQAHLIKAMRPARGRLRMIKRPDYLCLPHVPAVAARLAPKVKLVVVLRDPVKRALSAYIHMVRFGFLPVETAEAGLTKVFDGVYDGKLGRAQEVRNFGRYGWGLRNWREHFPRDAFFVTTFDALIADPTQVFDDVCQFLGLATGERPAGLTRVHNEGAYARESLEAYAKVGDIFFDYDETRMYRRRRTFIHPLKLIPGLITLRRARRLRRAGAPKPALSQDLMERIAGFYADDLAWLKADWGIDFPASSRRLSDVRAARSA